MSTTPLAPLVLSLTGPSLSQRSVAQIAGQIAASNAGLGVALILDCHAVSVVEPDGLCALLALADRHVGTRLIIAAASRAVLRAAVQTDLAEHFEFWARAELVSPRESG